MHSLFFLLIREGLCNIKAAHLASIAHWPFTSLLCSLKSEWRLSAAAPAFAFDADFSRRIQAAARMTLNLTKNFADRGVRASGEKRE